MSKDKPTRKKRQRKPTRRVRVNVKRFEEYGIERGDRATYLTDGEIGIGDFGFFSIPYQDYRYDTLAFVCEQDKTCVDGYYSGGARTPEDVCLRYHPSRCDGHHHAEAYGRVIAIERHGQAVETLLDLRAAAERDRRTSYPDAGTYSKSLNPRSHEAEALTSQHAISSSLIASPVVAGFTLADLLGLWPDDPAPFLFTLTNDHLRTIGLHAGDALIGFKTDDIKRGDLVLARIGERLLVRIYTSVKDCIILGTAGGDAISSYTHDIEIVGRIIQAMRKGGLANVRGVRPAHTLSNIPPHRETEDRRANFAHAEHWWAAAWSSRTLRLLTDKVALILANGTDEQQEILKKALEYRAKYSDVQAFFPGTDVYSPESLYLTEYCTSCRSRWTDDINKMEQLRKQTSPVYRYLSDLCRDLLTEKGTEKVRRELQTRKTPAQVMTGEYCEPLPQTEKGTKTFTADVDLPRNGISRGDKVVVELTGEVEDGHVGAVRHRCRVTINRIYHPDPDHVRIGEDYQDISRASSVEIIGPVVRVIKKKLPKDDDGILDADIIG